MNETAERVRFEAWVSAAPFENSVRRYADDEMLAAWPGQYIDQAVQLAWESWKAALRGESE